MRNREMIGGVTLLMTMPTHRLLLACALLLVSVAATAQTPPPDIDRMGPQVGERVPAFSGVDQFGKRQTLETALKADGAMLVFFRSADW
jgi:cytochrome oxidase Cu insertion factor (SCO1/SenC/PrrC family)